MGLRRLGGLGAEAVDEGLEPLDLGLLGRRHLPQPDLVRGAGLLVLAVGALVLDHVPLIEVQHARDRLIEQVEVVRHHEQGPAVAAEEAHEPLLGVGVEVVGGLVEDEDVAAGEEDARQLDPAALTTREHLQRQIEPVGAKAQASGDPAHLGLGGIATLLLELVMRSAVAVDVALRGVLLQLDAQLLHALDQLVEAPAGQHVVEGSALGRLGLGAGVLVEVAELARDRDGAAVGRVLSGQHPDEARLAGAVAPHQPGLVAGADGERRLDQGQASSHLDGQVADLEHRTSVAVPVAIYAARTARASATVKAPS
jgi:hypothetical protein